MMSEKKKISLLLDSGAFSCWRRREELDLDRYIEFIKHYSDSVTIPVNLDVIPAEWGRVPSVIEVEQSAEDGFVNSLYMRNKGVESMPVFHQGEQMKWLQAMVDEGFDWIGISPANDRTTSQKIVWLDEVFAFLGGETGYPKIKTHGFGVTAMEIMFRYPWYSVDSTTWLMIASYGGIMVPQQTLGGNGLDYTRQPYIVQVADRREDKPPPKSIMKSTGHIDHLGAAARDWVETYLDDEGLSLSDMRGHFKYRCQATALFYKRMMEQHTIPRFTREHAVSSGFFSQQVAKSDDLEGAESPLWERLNKYFTVPTSWQHSWALQTVGGCDERLISYYYFKDRPIDRAGLAYYAMHGIWERKNGSEETDAIDRSVEVG